MSSLQSLPWIDPLEAASSVEGAHWVLLYSSAQTSYSGQYSYLAFDPAEHVEASDFQPMEQLASRDRPWYENAWFGYLGYGLKDSLEQLTQDKPGHFPLPHLYLTRFNAIWRFDHLNRIIEAWPAGSRVTPKPISPTVLPPVAGLASNMTTQDYKQKVDDIIRRIQAGDLYQANLTRKFYGSFASPPDNFSVFRALCRTSPAPYSAYIHMGDTAIVSSSPELFLRIDANGQVRTRPIKGTSPRFADPAKDALSARQLAESTKDRAENLMIVDLMRNDLSRSCLPGSIRSQEMFEVTSHATVHHMSGTVTGLMAPGIKTIDVVKHCFPPGSMTGAPKIKAMNVCSELEEQARGIYSGAIGFFGGDGSAELSVVIRTLILQGMDFEFQVGGAIVADSDAESELQETLTKAQGIARTLNIPLSALENL